MTNAERRGSSAPALLPTALATTALVAAFMVAQPAQAAQHTAAQHTATQQYAVHDAGNVGYPTGFDNRGDYVGGLGSSFDVEGYVTSHSGSTSRLQPVDSQFVYPARMNNHGSSVGTASNEYFEPIPQEWNLHGANTPLVELPGADPTGADVEDAADINDAGMIAGTATDPATGQQVAVVWTSPTSIHVIATGVSEASATSINNAGLAAGDLDGHAAEFPAAGGAVPLERQPGEEASTVTDINDHGVAIGWSRLADGSQAYEQWGADGRAQRLGLDPTSINNRGDIAGSTGNRAVLRPAGRRVVHLPDLPASASAGQPGHNWAAGVINDHGAVIGDSVRNPGDGGYQEIITWTPDS